MGQGVNECWKADVMAELSINAMIDPNGTPNPSRAMSGNTNRCAAQGDPFSHIC
jgi:hypothetical protein